MLNVFLKSIGFREILISCKSHHIFKPFLKYSPFYWISRSKIFDLDPL